MSKIRALPVQKHHLFPPLLIILLAFVAYLFNDSLSQYLIYNRELVNNFEYWRLFSAHFFHTNYFHFLLNSVAVILLWALHGQYYNVKTYSYTFLLIAVFCALGLHFFSLDIQRYVGLSGILHGFFIWGALKDIQQKDYTGYLLLFGVIAKVTHEQFYGSSGNIEQIIDARVAIDAHLFGSIGGIISYVLFRKKYFK